MIACRNDSTPTPDAGERAKLEAHAVLEARRDVYVNRGRRALLKTLLLTGTATADDVRLVVDLPGDIDAKCFGAVPGALARAGIIRRAGFAQTTRKRAHARPVTVWQLIDRAGAYAWLAAHPDRHDPAEMGELFNGLTETKNADAATSARK